MEYLLFLLGVFCAGLGGEFFVRGVVGLGSWARIPPGIIGATLAAFATSSPELAVSINAAMAGKPNLALGDALGSNVVNVSLILALSLLVTPAAVPRDSIRRDFLVALTVPIATAILLLDGSLSRIDAALLITLFVSWLVATVIEVRRSRSNIEAVRGGAPSSSIGFSIAGLVLLVIAGRLIVSSSKVIAASWGLDEFIIGATVVAIGTSMPELATTVIASLRGHQEVALGTILGSNIFNGLWIVGIAASITPIAAPFTEVSAGLIAGVATVMLTYPKRGMLDRRRGAILLAFFLVYMTVMLQFRPGAA